MMNPPKTIPDQGLKFLEHLARTAGNNAMLDIKPLFGSSTRAIDLGQPGATIYAVEDFIAPDWVERKFNLSLSRQTYEKFTSDIASVKVLEVTWDDPKDIGFSNLIKEPVSLAVLPPMSNSTDLEAWLNALGDTVSDKTILAGSGFVGRAYGMVKALEKIAAENQVKLFVVGQVWAMCFDKNNARIEQALTTLSPKLENVYVYSEHEGIKVKTPAACWSSGLHGIKPLTALKVSGLDKGALKISTFQSGEAINEIDLSDQKLYLENIDQMFITVNGNFAIQFCLRKGGYSQVTKIISNNHWLDIKEACVTAVHLLET